MSFQSALSGLNAASRNLDVIGNNIANANTTGMKSSRAEFADLVASAGGGGGVSQGIGVAVATVSQQFAQGNINITGSDLDVAINGGGFFQVTMPDGSGAYTRDGAFKLDKVGNIITNSGANLMGFPTDKAGKIISVTPQPLQLPTSAPIGASATTEMTAEFNLDARAKVAATLPVTPRSTYGTSLNVFDAQGVSTPVTLYFEKDAALNTWNVFDSLAPAAAPIGQITFDGAGKITGPVDPSGAGFSLTLAAGTIATSNPNNATGFLPTPIAVHLDDVTQFGASFSVSNLTQDGYTSGELVGMQIGTDGVIKARYSNGETQAAGQIALADFRNVQGLAPVGSGNWIETNDSGQPVQGSPGQGKFGLLRAGALEESNVDLTAELVSMMTAQRAYQSNAQTIKTQDQVLSTLVNLR